ncbi:hypothetical protein QCA50_019050 [Cerrena zonata]|uniref:Uncharacterized protein n=1 Tax=Cerrena zonata TaxID=2478898 RepID=A0AAW0FEU0_9APHY
MSFKNYFPPPGLTRNFNQQVTHPGPTDSALPSQKVAVTENIDPEVLQPRDTKNNSNKRDESLAEKVSATISEINGNTNNKPISKNLESCLGYMQGLFEKEMKSHDTKIQAILEELAQPCDASHIDEASEGRYKVFTNVVRDSKVEKLDDSNAWENIKKMIVNETNKRYGIKDKCQNFSNQLLKVCHDGMRDHRDINKDQIKNFRNYLQAQQTYLQNCLKEHITESSKILEDALTQYWDMKDAKSISTKYVQKITPQITANQKEHYNKIEETFKIAEDKLACKEWLYKTFQKMLPTDDENAFENEIPLFPMPEPDTVPGTVPETVPDTVPNTEPEPEPSSISEPGSSSESKFPSIASLADSLPSYPQRIKETLRKIMQFDQEIIFEKLGDFSNVFTKQPPTGVPKNRVMGRYDTSPVETREHILKVQAYLANNSVHPCYWGYALFSSTCPKGNEFFAPRPTDWYYQVATLLEGFDYFYARQYELSLIWHIKPKPKDSVADLILYNVQQIISAKFNTKLYLFKELKTVIYMILSENFYKSLAEQVMNCTDRIDLYLLCLTELFNDSELGREPLTKEYIEYKSYCNDFDDHEFDYESEECEFDHESDEHQSDHESDEDEFVYDPNREVPGYLWCDECGCSVCKEEEARAKKSKKNRDKKHKKKLKQLKKMADGPSKTEYTI